MSAILLAALFSVSGLMTKNPADCMGLPSDQSMECTREIRAGRSYDVHYPEDPFQRDTAKPSEITITPVVAQPVRPPCQENERLAAAAERSASATETIATLMVAELFLSIAAVITVFVVSK